MEFRKIVMITLYAREQKRHRCIEQSFGLCGRGRGCDDLGEWHWNMYNIVYEMNHQSRFNAWYWMLGAGALRWPRGMVRGVRWDEGSGWGTRVHPWRIHHGVYTMLIHVDLARLFDLAVALFKKRHRCIEQSFGLWERGRVGWFGTMALKHV